MYALVYKFAIVFQNSPQNGLENYFKIAKHQATILRQLTSVLKCRVSILTCFPIKKSRNQFVCVFIIALILKLCNFAFL